MTDIPVCLLCGDVSRKQNGVCDACEEKMAPEQESPVARFESDFKKIMGEGS
jgi:predicted amidophosphoribosyltransferase